tara:strand:- start:57 stop:896 length:840 start_codon:yes stop_codon:yes gene_type:complete
MTIRSIPNSIPANEIDFVHDPRKTNTIRLFDDFIGGALNTGIAAKFHTFGTTSGGVWNAAASFDTLEPTGFESFGTVQAETNTGATARSLMHLAQLVSNSPADGDRWLWEVRVRPELASGNGFWSMSIVRADGGDGFFTVDGIPGTNNRPRCSVFAKKDNVSWKTHVSDSESSQAGTTGFAQFTNDLGGLTRIDYNDDTFVRIAALVTYEASGTKYDVKFFIDGVQIFNTELTAGSGSPFGKCFLYNNGTGAVQRATYDWSLIQFPRTEAVDFIDIDTL